ncbi:MAG: HAMP domain-containing sensor histidine kinase [Anaerolineales bacterium]
MNRKSIRWRLPASYAVIALVAALALGSMMLLVLRKYYARQELDYLYGNAVALKPILEELMQSNAPQVSLQDQVEGLAFLSQTQIKVYDTNNRTIADSGIPGSNQIVAVSGRPPLVGNVTFSTQAEPPKDGQARVLVFSAGGEVSKQTLPEGGLSVVTGTTDIVVPVSASPYGYGFVQRIESDPAHRSAQKAGVILMTSTGKQLGMLEFSNGPTYGADVVNSVTIAWLLASIFAVAIAALMGWFMSRRVTSPVLALENATQKMEQGDLSVRVHLQDEKQQEFLSLANSFNGMAEQVEQTVSTLRAFVADAAHELHTPLTALQANLELARDEKNASVRTRYLVRVQEQAQRLEALVKSLLDLSRIEAAKSKSEFEPLNFIQVVNEVGEQFASRAEQTGHEFTVDIPVDESVTVNGNETQLKQVLNNLLENAIKFTPEKGSIQLRLEQDEHQAIVTVSDTGIGIPPEDLPHLFERFHRGRNSSAFPGNGLGLAIVKAIIEMHDGTVQAQSEGKDAGSSFTITLPT